MPMRNQTEILGGVSVALIGTLMFHFIFGDTWGESVGLGITAGLVNAVTQVGMRRAGERRIARQEIGMRARILLGIGVFLIAIKIALDLGETGPAGVRAVLGVVAIMSLLFAVYEVVRKAAQSR
jgi:hypothetical protein